MIIRKPFKFLIKHFKIINVILLLLMGFVCYKCGMLVYFFRSFVSNRYVTEEVELASKYIGFILPIVSLLIVAASIIIYILFKSKDKNDKVYLSLIVFYTVVFVLTNVCRGILNSIEVTTIESSSALLYRDISRFVFYPQFILMFFVFLNCIGFDLSTLSFTNLQDDIDIAESDDQEIEIGVKLEDYKIKRTLRRSIRELRYYVIENKQVFWVIGGIVLAIILFFAGRFIFDLNRTVRVDQSFNHSNFNIALEDSIITTRDYQGNVIREGTNYLAVVVKVSNKSKSAKVLDTDNFWLDIGGEYVYPTLDRSGKFLDLGEPYYGDKIGAGETHKYVICYELSDKQLKGKYNIKILDSIEYKNNIANPRYKEISLSPKVSNDIKDNGIYKLEDYIVLNNTKLLSSSIKINSYYLTRIYTYLYDNCFLDECDEKKDTISTKTDTRKVLMVLSDELSLDSNSNYMTYKKLSNFYEDFVTLEYGYGDSTMYSSTSDVSRKNDKSGNVVLEVDAGLMKADYINMIITIRNMRTKIVLKSAE